MSDLLFRANEANLRALNGDLTGAAAEFEDVLREIENGRAFFGEAGIRSDFARVLHDMRDPRQARQLTMAAALFQKSGDVPRFVDACLRMCALTRDSTRVALYWVDRALAMAERSGRPEDLVRPLAVRGELLLAENRADEALPIFERVLALPGGEAFASLLARAQVLTGHSEQGLKTLTLALEDAERSQSPGSDETTVALRIRLAEARRALGDRRAALQILQEAEPRSVALTDITLFSSLMDRLGFALLESGDPAAAVERFEQGIDRVRADAPAQSGLLASLFHNLGNALAALGNVTGALRALTQSVDLARDVGNARSQALGLFALANVAAKIDGAAGDAQARDAYDESRALAVQLGDRSLEAACLDSLGQIEMKNKAPARAVDLHRRAADLHHEIHDATGEHIDLLNLVQSYLLLGEVAAARRALNEADALAAALDRVSWHHAFRHGQVLARERRWDEARSALDTAITQLERERETLETAADQRRWAAQRVEAFELAAAAAFDAGDALAALAYLEGNRARFLEAVAAFRRQLPEDLGPAGRDAYIAASNRLSDLRWRRREHPDRDDPELDRALAAAKHQFDRLDANVQHLRAGRQARVESMAPPQRLAERLAPGEAAVALHVTDDLIGAACIGRQRDGAMWWTCGTERGRFTLSDLSRLVIGRAAEDPGTADSAWKDLTELTDQAPGAAATLVAKTCATLRDAVWPLIERLVADKADVLVLMPGRGLNVLPLHAAATSAQQPAIDRWSIRYVPSLALLPSATAPDAPAARTLGLVVNPTGDLPFADVETAAAGKAWNGDRLPPLRGAAAEPAAVMGLFHASDVLHFAGHGAFVPDDPLESHLLCAPGNAGNVVTLRMLLETGSAVRTRVVILSACETGRVVAEDALNDQLGLPGGLLVAGASAVLATFWPVSDLAAGLVLSETVRIWAREPVNLETALARAQTWLRTRATAAVVTRWLDEQRTDDALMGEALDEARASLAGLSPDALLFTDELSWAAFHVSGDGVRS